MCLANTMMGKLNVRLWRHTSFNTLITLILVYGGRCMCEWHPYVHMIKRVWKCYESVALWSFNNLAHIHFHVRWGNMQGFLLIMHIFPWRSLWVLHHTSLQCSIYNHIQLCFTHNFNPMLIPTFLTIDFQSSLHLTINKSIISNTIVGKYKA